MRTQIYRYHAASVIARVLMEDNGFDPKDFKEIRDELKKHGINEYTDDECTTLDNEMARYSIKNWGGTATMCAGRPDGAVRCTGIDESGKLVLVNSDGKRVN